MCGCDLRLPLPLQYHPYVQFDRFLAKCFVGNLIRDSAKTRKISSPAYLTTPGGRQLHVSKPPPSTLSLTPTAPTPQPLLEVEEEGEEVVVVVESSSRAPTVHTPDSGIVIAGEWSSCCDVT